MSEMNNVNYGPLKDLIGNWEGSAGVDIAPEPDGEETNPYFETIAYTAAGNVSNAETQKLSAVHYHDVVSRKSDGDVFHNETGYWLWDAERQTVMQTLTIPRGVSLIAGGEYAGNLAGAEVVLEVRTAVDDPDWGTVQSPFMRENAKTLSFSHRISIDGDKMAYHETTMVEIYAGLFEHTDENVLHRA